MFKNTQLKSHKCPLVRKPVKGYDVVKQIYKDMAYLYLTWTNKLKIPYLWPSLYGDECRTVVWEGSGVMIHMELVEKCTIWGGNLMKGNGDCSRVEMRFTVLLRRNSTNIHLLETVLYRHPTIKIICLLIYFEEYSFTLNRTRRMYVTSVTTGVAGGELGPTA